MVGKVTILCLVRVATPPDDVHTKPASAQMVHGCSLARARGGGAKTGSMGNQKSRPLGDGRGMGADEEAIWRIGEIANQNAIEISLLVGEGRCGDDVSIERRSTGCQHLGRYARRDPTNHLDRQSSLQVILRAAGILAEG